jgi:hypothetical protein
MYVRNNAPCQARAFLNPRLRADAAVLLGSYLTNKLGRQDISFAGPCTKDCTM